MARAGQLVAETIALARRAGPARHHDRRSSTGSPRTSSASTAASRRPRATAAFPRRPASRRTRWSCTASRAATGSRRATSCRSTSASRSTGSWPTAPTPSRSARSIRRHSACSRWDKQALAAGIDQARSGNRVGDISHAVQQVVEGAGFSVVRSLVGHGVGRSYHEEPQIPNFGEPGRGPLLQSGMTLAIEPMITAGGPEVYLHDDEWSISTEDGSLAAHFEHTVAVAEEGPPRVLTAAKSRERAGLVP